MSITQVILVRDKDHNNYAISESRTSRPVNNNNKANHTYDTYVIEIYRERFRWQKPTGGARVLRRNREYGKVGK